MADLRATFGGSMPGYYDGIMAGGQFDTFAQDLVERVSVKPAGGVLELACGTGVATRRLRERLDKEVRLVATDLSEAMLGFAQRKLAGTPGIEWRQADAGALPFGDAEFGALVCAFGVMFVPDKKKLFAELRRVLDKGGAVGKRLDFLMQELNREANTLGSKAADIAVTQVSMELKLLIEQMREQIQNIE